MGTLNQILADARANYFAGLREAVAEQFAEFERLRDELHAEERANGEPLTLFGSADKSVAVKTVTKPVGFSNKEDQLSKREMLNRFGHLLTMEPNARLREAVKIHLENPGLNHSHLSRSLGRSSNWFGLQMYRARSKGML